MSIGSDGIFRWKAHVFSLDDLSGGVRRGDGRVKVERPQRSEDE